MNISDINVNSYTQLHILLKQDTMLLIVCCVSVFRDNINDQSYSSLKTSFEKVLIFWSQ